MWGVLRKKNPLNLCVTAKAVIGMAGVLLNLGVDLNQFDFLVNKSSPEKRHEFSLFFLVDYV